jgi:hypothetical protein
VRELAALTFAGAAVGALGGIVFWLAHGNTTAARAVAYGLWIAAAACLVLPVAAGRRTVWRRTSLNAPEGWAFVGAAVALSVLGAAVDALG